MLKLTYSVIIIIYLLTGVNLQHTDNQAIVFRYKEKYESDFYIIKYQPLDIVLDNFFAVHGWCLNFFYTGPGSKFVKCTHFNGSSDAVIHVPKVTDEMITKWWCVILRPLQLNTKDYLYHNISYTAYNIAFNLHNNRASIATTSSTSLLTYKLIWYVIVPVVLAIVIILVIILLVKKCCVKPKKSEIPTPARPNPDRFYLNLELFRREYERELQAQEPEYEEINN